MSSYMEVLTPFTCYTTASKFRSNSATLATLIEKSGQTGDSIRLISCKSGASAEGIAQNLANKPGLKVTAPTDTLWIHPNGTMTIGKTPTANTGRWVTFTPGGA